MKSLLNITFILLFLNGCNNIQTSKVSINSTPSDSIVNCYIKTFDSFTLNPAKNDPAIYFLKAYKNQDTSLLIAAYDSLKIQVYFDSLNSNRFNRVGLKKIEALKYKEVYRFQYSRSFCDKTTIITIGKLEDTIEMETLIIQDDHPVNVKLFSSSKISLTTNQWDDFLNELNHADFWGLKQRNGNEGFDGASLYVYGLEKPQSYYAGRSNSVYRWAPLNYPIGKLFLKLYRLSKNKVDCYYEE